MKGGIVIIQCSRCPAHMAAGCSVEAFAAALEERGWRMTRGPGSPKRQIVCPDCAKKVEPKDLIEPKRARAIA